MLEAQLAFAKAVFVHDTALTAAKAVRDKALTEAKAVRDKAEARAVYNNARAEAEVVFNNARAELGAAIQKYLAEGRAEAVVLNEQAREAKRRAASYLAWTEAEKNKGK